MPLRMNRPQRSHLNLTPMIDVLFLLIIFFMVGTEFAEEESQLSVKLPRAGTANPTAADSSRVKQLTLLSTGKLALDGQLFTDLELQSKLQTLHAQHPDLAVIVRGDSSATLQRLVEVMNLCRNAGILQQGIQYTPLATE